jgi:hypothetical protein
MAVKKKKKTLCFIPHKGPSNEIIQSLLDCLLRLFELRIGGWLLGLGLFQPFPHILCDTDGVFMSAPSFSVKSLASSSSIVCMMARTAFLAYWTVTYAVTKRWCKGCDQGTQSANTADGSV